MSDDQDPMMYGSADEQKAYMEKAWERVNQEIEADRDRRNVPAAARTPIPPIVGVIGCDLGAKPSLGMVAKAVGASSSVVPPSSTSGGDGFVLRIVVAGVAEDLNIPGATLL